MDDEARARVLAHCRAHVGAVFVVTVQYPNGVELTGFAEQIDDDALVLRPFDLEAAGGVTTRVDFSRATAIVVEITGERGERADSSGAGGRTRFPS